MVRVIMHSPSMLAHAVVSALQGFSVYHTVWVTSIGEYWLPLESTETHMAALLLPAMQYVRIHIYMCVCV